MPRLLKASFIIGFYYKICAFLKTKWIFLKDFNACVSINAILNVKTDLNINITHLVKGNEHGVYKFVGKLLKSSSFSKMPTLAQRLGKMRSSIPDWDVLPRSQKGRSSCPRL